MNTTTRTQELEQALAAAPLLDAHTHLIGGKLAARGLHDVLLYHMIVSDLYAAGCPSGARLTQYPGWPTVQEAHARIDEAVPYLRHIQHTGTAWCLRIILADLYDWRDPITVDNWRRLDDIIRERADDRAWQHQVLDRVKIERTVTEIARRESGSDDDRFQYALEWGFFTRGQWGEYDTALYELERCWGQHPESPLPIGSGGRPATERTIHTLADVHAALDHYVKSIPYDQILATATHLSTDIDYRLVGDAEMEQALARRAGVCPRLAAEMRALVALAAALQRYEHAADRGRGQPERRRYDRLWAARPRGDTADTPAAMVHASDATSA